jgi:hypothetical protein
MIPGYRRSAFGGLAGVIMLVGFFLSFAFGGFNLAIFFLALAIAIFLGSLSTGSPRSVYGTLYGSLWLFILALFFATGSWIWFVIGGIFCCVMGSLTRPILASLGYVSTCGTARVANRQPQQYYQPSEQAYQPPETPYRSYEQGYRPLQPETNQEGSQQQYPPAEQYEEPQAQYPQPMPPQQ